MKPFGYKPKPVNNRRYLLEAERSHDFEGLEEKVEDEKTEKNVKSRFPHLKYSI